MLNKITSQSNIQTALEWVLKTRHNFPSNADVWHLLFHKKTELPNILKNLRSGYYTFSAMQLVTNRQGEEVAIWSATDAFVLKLLTLSLQSILPIHSSCTHIKGHGGHKAAVRQAHHWIAGGAYKFVCKTDIRAYYASIDKHQLLDLLTKYIHCPITPQLSHLKPWELV